MGRRVAVALHASLSLIAGALYFLFVLPRWWELSYEISHSFGTVMRIVCGAIIGLAALPVVFTLLRARKPEYGTPRMALTLQLWSVVLHVLAGALIIAAAISEIWLSLDDAGQWLFGVYGAAAAIAILGIAAFYLAFVAAMPPPAPRPLKSKERKRRLRRKDKEADESDDEVEEAAEAEKESAAEETAESDEESPAEEPAEEKPAEVSVEADEAAPAAPADDAEEKPTGDADEKPADEELPASDDTVAAEPARGGLRNRRPSGKTTTSRRRRRLRGGVAVED